MWCNPKPCMDVGVGMFATETMPAYTYYPMIFSRKNAGKWVASKDGKVIAATTELPSLVKKVEKRRDKDAIRFDLVPPRPYLAGPCGVPVR